jgi:hypothetical protein
MKSSRSMVAAAWQLRPMDEAMAYKQIADGTLSADATKLCDFANNTSYVYQGEMRTYFLVDPEHRNVSSSYAPWSMGRFGIDIGPMSFNVENYGTDHRYMTAQCYLDYFDAEVDVDGLTWANKPAPTGSLTIDKTTPAIVRYDGGAAFTATHTRTVLRTGRVLPISGTKIYCVAFRVALAAQNIRAYLSANAADVRRVYNIYPYAYLQDGGDVPT